MLRTGDHDKSIDIGKVSKLSIINLAHQERVCSDAGGFGDALKMIQNLVVAFDAHGANEKAHDVGIFKLGYHQVAPG